MVAAHDMSPDSESAHATGRSGARATLRRHWPALRFLVGIGAVGIALWVLDSHTDELSGFSGVLEHLNWIWVLTAIGAEMISFVCFAALQYALLERGGLQAPKGSLLKVTFAAQALTSSLPAGVAVAAVYGFRWFRRFGADSALAAWATAGTVVASTVSLALVATLGLSLAAGEGASLDLIPAIIGVLLATIAVGALFVYEKPMFFVLSSVVRASHALVGRPKANVAAHIDRLMVSVTSVRLGWREVIVVVALGTANWLFDCACFAMMFLAVHSSIPWKGLLLAYGAGQLAAALPITPGGLGAVEGSITIALVAFGGARTTTVDAVLLYRMVSFWLVLVVGWVLCGELALEVRRGRWSRQALTARIDARMGSRDGSVPLPAASPRQSRAPAP
jgi:putative heme transporter